MNKIAFVTTCKGRLHHLAETLPLIVSAAPDEIVVVDYGCPDGAGDWVEKNFPTVRLLRISDDPGFCLARARNVGAAAVSAEWICFIDADIRIDPEWLSWLREHVKPGVFYRAAEIAGERDKETWGTVVCQKVAFDLVGGYDEAYRGWGGEDDDLYARLALPSSHQKERSYPSRFVSPISHDNDERTKFHQIKNKELQSKVNQYYREAKWYLMESFGSDIPLNVRQALMLQIANKFRSAAQECPEVSVRALRPRILVALAGLREGQDLMLEFCYQRRYLICGPRNLVVRGR